MDTRPGGLFPHDLARDALIADLKWRNPDWYVELHRRARTYYIRHIEHGQGVEQQLALFDLVFLHRDNPVVRPVFEWQASGRVLPGAVQAADLPKLVAMVAKHEGLESARLADLWLSEQPESAVMFRDSEGEPAGFVHFLSLSALTPDQVCQDPALVAATAMLDKTVTLRAGERVSYFRH